jgi:glycosyltransferase involved in cell wall biosynthesis
MAGQDAPRVAGAAIRVAIGPVDPAGSGAALAEGLREHGVDAEVAVSFRHPFGLPSDRVLGRAKRVFYGLALPARADVVHYQSGWTWTPAELDARWARLCGRTLVVGYHGDDCRLYGLTRTLFPTQAPVKTPAGDAAVRRRLRRISRLCHGALVKDLELATYVYPFFERVYLVPPGIRGDFLRERRPKRAHTRTPVVLHAPSDPRYKGTPLIESAVEAVARRTPLDFRLLHGVPQDVLRAELRRADVLVDQVNAAATGVLALEAMALGVPVLAEYDPAVLAPFQTDVPIVRVSPDTLAQELDDVLGDPERRHDLAERGRDYVERVHAPARVAAAALRVYDHVRQDEYGLWEATADALRPLDARPLEEWLARAGASVAPRPPATPVEAG